jgi:hypothetical protein
VVDVVLGQETTFAYNASQTTIFRVPARIDPEVFQITERNASGETFSISYNFCFLNTLEDRWFLEGFGGSPAPCAASPCNYTIPVRYKFPILFEIEC